MDSIRPEAATGDEVEQRLRSLPEAEAAKIRARLRPMPFEPQAGGSEPSSPPKYGSWEDYLAATSVRERRAWCVKKASCANRERLMSGSPDHRLTSDDVWFVLEAARGRCAHCGSLAVENRPSRPDGAPLPWAPVGRRIGSLGHVVARLHGGPNTVDNLAWSCPWCNTWPDERRPDAVDHGAIR